MGTRHKDVLIVLGLLAFALLVRTHHIVGFGLGDDAYYAWTTRRILEHGLTSLDLEFGSNYRFGLWLPLAACFALFDMSDLSFVLFPLASSVLLVWVVCLYCLLSADARGKACCFLVWWGVSFAFLEFYPAEWKAPYRVLPRFERYVHTFVPATSLIAGVFLASIWQRARAAGRTLRDKGLGPVAAHLPAAAVAVLLLLYVVGSAAQGLRNAILYEEHYVDGRIAAAHLAALSPEPIYCDHLMRDQFNFYTGWKRDHQVKRSVDGVNIRSELVGRRNLEPLRGLGRGYVVFGGSRGVHTNEAILTKGSFEPPEDWRLILELERPLDKFRSEPLRIYEISG